MNRSLDIRLLGTTSADCLNTFIANGIDPDTGESDAIDLTGVTVTVSVRDKNRSEKWRGTNADGVTVDVPTSGEFTVWIPAATMASLDPDQYAVGCTLYDGIVTVQFLLGSLTVRDGIV